MAKASSEKPRPLDALNWVSFHEGFDDDPYRTIWQAVQHLMLASFVDERIYKEYLNAINDIEFELMRDLAFEHLSMPSKIIVPDGVDEYIRFANARLIELDNDAIDRRLEMLDLHRYAAIEHLALPATIYLLLSREIDKSRNGLPTPLKIKAHESKRLATGLVRFSTRSLDSWSAVNALISLDLGTTVTPERKRSPRSELTENRDMVIGMLTHILAELFPRDLKTDLGKGKIKISQIEQLISANTSQTPGVGFPQKSTLNDILGNALSIIDRPDALAFTSYHKTLKTHYETVQKAINNGNG